MAAQKPLTAEQRKTRRLVQQQRKAATRECPVHGFQRHGKEAEELRAGIEELIAGADDSVDRDARVVSVVDLQRLVDKVDARDSLAFIERATVTKGHAK